MKSTIKGFCGAAVLLTSLIVAPTAKAVTIFGVAAWDGTQWTQLFATPSVGGEFSMILDQAGDVIAGGSFTFTQGSTTYRRILRYTGAGLSTLGGGLNNAAFGIAVDADNNIYAVGLFTAALDAGGGAVANTHCIAKWDGSAWQTVSGSLPACTGLIADPLTHSVAVDLATSDVYVAGKFTQIGESSTSANNVARWDGSQWFALGNGVVAPTLARYKLNFSNNNLFVGGRNQVATDLPASHGVSQWNGSTWSTMSGGVTGSAEQASSFTSQNSQLYVGGLFTTAGTGGGAVPAANLGGYDVNLSTWRGSTGATADGVVSLAFDATNHIYAGTGTSNGVVYIGDVSIPGSVTMTPLPQQLDLTEVDSLLLLPQIVIGP